MKHLIPITFIIFALATGCETTPSTGGGSSGPPVGGASGSDSDGGGIDVNVGVDVGGVNIPLPGGLPGVPGLPGGHPSGSGDGDGAGKPGAGSSEPDPIPTGEDILVWEPQPGFEDSADASGSSDRGNASLEDIEKTLDEAMGTFDEEILREQENARNKTGNNGASDNSNTEVLAGVGTFETYGKRGSGGGSVPGPTTANPGATVFNGDGGLATEDGPPPDADDDIVARQIREAAESEPDPEQRAVLWEEYKRYKSRL